MGENSGLLALSHFMMLNHRFFFGLAVLSFILVVSIFSFPTPAMSAAPQLLSDPFLQLPMESSVRVVWFTEFAGLQHTVTYGPDLNQTVTATTTQLSRMREDAGSRLADSEQFSEPQAREIWRHEANVTGLSPRDRVPYRVTSIREDGQSVSSNLFSLASAPPAHVPLKILLTSDHQLMPMTTANLQKVEETVGRVDAVFMAGDLVNVPDRASEWFDDQRGGAFFPALQGRGHYDLEREGRTTRYRGGEIIQHAPIFPTVGNHEVMGRFSTVASLSRQFSDARPRAVAQVAYDAKAEQINPDDDPQVRQAWIKNASFNTDTFAEIFTLPPNRPAGKNYYAVTFGDIRLVVLYATNIWRTPDLEPSGPGRYAEAEANFNNPSQWGYGQHIFEAIAQGSEQYNWLVAELGSPAFQQARYKVVMLHHPPHTLGGNIVPAYTDPVQIIERDEQGAITAIRYEYPKDQDYLIRDVMPLLEEAGVQLVYYGHSHLWNRFVSPDGKTHYLESSNVGNSYGAHLGEEKRPVPTGYQEEYAAVGDPYGLEPVMPAIAPLQDAQEQPLPYIASNDITAFSILDTGTATVRSYRFDTRQSDSPVVLFDEFSLFLQR